MGAKQKSPLKIECFHPEGKCLKSNYTSLLVGRSAQFGLFRFEGSLAFQPLLSCSSSQDQGRKFSVCSKESR